MRHTPLTRNGDFVRAYRRGKAFVHPYVVLYVNKNRGQGTRAGITASKKVGGAVTRNRARRVLRQALWETLPPRAGHVDVVLVARGQTAAQKSTRVAQALRGLLAKAGLPQSPKTPPGGRGRKE